MKKSARLSLHNLSTNSDDLSKALPLFKIIIVSLITVFSRTVMANDSTGYIGTGGVQYLKNHDISMQSEDLFISKDIFKVDYQFANLTNRDITETVLFPLPAFAKPFDGDFAYPEELIKSFKVYADDVSIIPDLHIRTFMPVETLTQGNVGDSDSEMIDTTQLFEDCGITKSEMMGDWLDYNNPHTDQKLLSCDHIALKAMQNLHKTQKENEGHSNFDYGIYWESQPIYSWEQTFKANTNTHLRHTYKPLVGGTMYFTSDDYENFCADSTVNVTHEKLNVHSELKYILTTGANWATPIKDFTLTVERDPDEIMSFCWEGKGEIHKIGPTTFQIKEKNFIPTHDFHVAFIR